MAGPGHHLDGAVRDRSNVIRQYIGPWLTVSGPSRPAIGHPPGAIDR